MALEQLKSEIPRVRPFPDDSVQCDGCGGNGCEICGDKGWLEPRDHPDGRRCLNSTCNLPLRPDHIAVYHSNDCAAADA